MARGEAGEAGAGRTGRSWLCIRRLCQMVAAPWWWKTTNAAQPEPCSPSRPSALRASLRFAVRALTVPRGPGPLATKSFGDETGGTRRLHHQSSWMLKATSDRRRHPKGRNEVEERL